MGRLHHLGWISFLFAFGISVTIWRDVATTMGIRSSIPYRLEIFALNDHHEIIDTTPLNCSGPLSCSRHMCLMWEQHHPEPVMWLGIQRRDSTDVLQPPPYSACVGDLLEALNHRDGSSWAWGAIACALVAIFVNLLVLCSVKSHPLMLRMLLVTARVFLFFAALFDTLLPIMLEDQMAAFILRANLLFGSFLLAIIFSESCLELAIFHSMTVGLDVLFDTWN